MSQRHDYHGHCDECDRRVSRGLTYSRSTINPGPEQWLRCRECETIVLGRRETNADKINRWGGGSA